jgi:uncharacterized protein YcbX
MIRIEKMYYAPVKSLALAEIERATLDKPGIAGDRAFFIVDARGKLVTQREVASLVQVKPDYDVAAGRLVLTFPNERRVSGAVELGGEIRVSFFDMKPVEAHVVRGEWNDALSEFAGQPLRLVKIDRPGSAFDAFPISICSIASLEAFAGAARQAADDGRRFRQNIYLSGASPHEEDEWVGGEVSVGRALLRVKMPDPRCVMTTHNPDTGETDLDSLKIIAGYRTDQPKEVNFGVYCTVAEPGEAAVGDEVKPA